MPVSKKRKKKRAVKPSGPPISKRELAAKKRKLTKRQIFIYVFSALIILSFALSFVVGYGGDHSGAPDVSGGDNGSILFTPVPGAEDVEAEDNSQPHDNSMSTEGEAEN